MEEPTEAPQANYCPRHPRNQTNLRCGRCGELICSECMVHTPVGVRCPRCANIRRIPTYDVTKAYLARGIVAGLLMGLALGIGFIFINRALLLIPILIPYLHIAVIAGIGYVIGETVSLAVNRKRGRSLKFVSAGSMFVASVPITFAITGVFGNLPLLMLVGMALAFWLSIRRF